MDALYMSGHVVDPPTVMVEPVAAASPASRLDPPASRLDPPMLGPNFPMPRIDPPMPSLNPLMLRMDPPTSMPDLQAALLDLLEGERCTAREGEGCSTSLLV